MKPKAIIMVNVSKRATERKEAGMKNYNEMITWVGEENARKMLELRASGADRDGIEYAEAFAAREAHLEAVCLVYGVDEYTARHDAAKASQAYRAKMER